MTTTQRTFVKDRQHSRWRDLGLSTRLNLTTASILVVTMAAFVTMDYVRERNALLEAEAERLATVGASAIRTLPNRLSKITTEDLRVLASTIAERPVSVYLVRDGQVVMSSSPNAKEMGPLKKVDWSGSFGLWWTPTGLAVTVPYPSSEAGARTELFVETSLDSVKRVLGRTLRMHVIHGLATVFAMSLGVAWVLRRSVHRPLARMISAMNVMERGTWELDLPVSSRDEVGVLTTCFNRMGKKLTRTAFDFARAEKLAALAVLSSRLRRELDAPLSEIESASSRLRARDRSQELESDALRIEAAAALSRRAIERLDDFFLAELNVKADSDCRDSCERASEGH